ncbi:nucleotide-diphospho-sugar transferase [Obelidium mucronatum]|nr:nucleotide-diphospho-sugar transferase [Obelidium mucronatum]
MTSPDLPLAYPSKASLGSRSFAQKASSFAGGFAKRLRRLLPALALLLFSAQFVLFVWNLNRGGARRDDELAAVVAPVRPSIGKTALASAVPSSTVVALPTPTSTSTSVEDVNSPHYRFSTGTTKNAYAFFGTDNGYTCSMLVAIAKLLETNPDPAIDIVFLYTGSVVPEMLDAFNALGSKYKNKFLTVQVQFDKALLHDQDYYKYCGVKLYVYSLYQYDRVILMDSDGFPLHNLDHLFSLPSTPIAAGRDYWDHTQGKLSAAFIVVEPSELNFNTVIAYMLKTKTYEMDVLQDAFPERPVLLPPEYVCLNTHWESFNLFPFPEKTLEDLYNKRCMYLHFSAVYNLKPHNKRPEEILKYSPGTPFLLMQQYVAWWAVADKVCPPLFHKEQQEKWAQEVAEREASG